MRIKPFGRAVPMSEHVACELRVIFGRGGEVYTAFGLISTCLDSPIDPLFLEF